MNHSEPSPWAFGPGFRAWMALKPAKARMAESREGWVGVARQGFALRAFALGRPSKAKSGVSDAHGMEFALFTAAPGRKP
jgi:hypothetical protein